MAYFKNLYYRFYNYISTENDRANQTQALRVHFLISVTAITAILMWAYAFLSYLYVDHISIKYTGFIYAIIHLLCPFFYKKTKSVTIATYLMLIPGGLFQVHFAYLTGGFYSSTLIWVGILPLIAGLLINLKHAVVFAAFSLSGILFCFFETMMSSHPTNFLHEDARPLAQFQIAFGMVILNSIFTVFLLRLWKKSNQQQIKKTFDKQNILRVLVHDVSNPLTVISGITKKLVAKDNIPPRFKEKIKIINDRSNDMVELIELIRKMEAHDSGKKEVSFDSMSINEIFTHCEDSFSYLAKIKNIQLNFTPCDAPPVYNIKGLIEFQVIGNILSNALKFAPENTTVDISAENLGAEVLISISDRGKGISSDLKEIIFDPTKKTSNLGLRGERGTGFGLPIAANAISLIGGRIEVESKTIDECEDSHGSTFKIYLKIDLNSDQQLEDEDYDIAN